jgi:hypothetical protein
MMREMDELESDLHREEKEGKKKIDDEISAIKRDKLGEYEEKLKKGKNTKDF